MPWNIGSSRDLVRRTAPIEPNTAVSASQKPQSPLLGFSQTSILPLVDSFLPASGIQNFPSLDEFWFKLIYWKQSPSYNQGDSGRWAQPGIAGTVIIITHILPICWLLASASQWTHKQEDVQSSTGSLSESPCPMTHYTDSPNLWLVAHLKARSSNLWVGDLLSHLQRTWIVRVVDFSLHFYPPILYTQALKADLWV